MYTSNKQAGSVVIGHLHDTEDDRFPTNAPGNFYTTEHLAKQLYCKIAFVVSDENVNEKREILQKVEKVVAEDTIIAINIESIALSELSGYAKNPQRVIGANWVEPVHTTAFLEIITNKYTGEEVAGELSQLARSFWGKDPYILKSDHSIRSRVMAALVREAFYLIKNGYSTIEDIDRACRNDAGYYLPFAGNFRYMDLMGTYAYGMVMENLNPELCKDKEVPAWVMSIISNGGEGMEKQKGFYHYTEEEVMQWEEKIRSFSHEIKNIMDKYPTAPLL